MKGLRLKAALLSWLPLVYGQSSPITITIGVGYCSTTPWRFSSMTSGTIGGSPTSSALPAQSSTMYTDANGQAYLLHFNTGLSGTTINPAPSRKRQDGYQSGTNGTLEQCLDSCDDTPACKAVNYLGSSCLLFSFIKGEMFLGGEAAYNLARFTGYSNGSEPIAASTVSSSSPGLPPTIAPSPSSAPAMASPPVVGSSVLTIPWSSVAPPIASVAPTQSQPPPIVSSAAASVSSYPIPWSSLIVQPPSSSPQPLLTMSSSSSTPLLSPSLAPPLPSSVSLPSVVPSSLLSSVGSSILVFSNTPSSATSSPVSSTPATSSSSQFPAVESSSSPLAGSSSQTSRPSSMSSVPPSSSRAPTPSINGATTSSALFYSSSSSLLPRSLSSSSFPAPSPSGVYSCPANDNSTVTNTQGIQYSVECGSDTSGGLLSVQQASSSFNDCFGFCDSLANCAGFTYVGGTNGNGAGNCYLKSGTVGFSGSGAGRVAGVRLTSPSLTSSSVLASSTLASSTPSSTLQSSSIARLSSSTQAASSSLSSAAAASAPTYVRNNGKRGLCYTNDSYTLQYSQAGQNSRVSWSYDYFYSRFTSNNPNNMNPALTFIPLMFSDAADLGAIWIDKAQAAINDGADALTSFNEPDLCIDGSACMSINRSVVAYQKYFQPFAGKVRLGAPAVTNQGAPGGLTYLQYFLGNCTGCQVDFINLHWYSNKYAGLGYLQTFVQQAYAMSGKPIWLTEFGLDNSEGTPTDADVQTFLQQALPWLDAYPHIERYAYFYDGPGFLINSNGSGLSARGVIYNSYTAPCPHWNNMKGVCT